MKCRIQKHLIVFEPETTIDAYKLGMASMATAHTLALKDGELEHLAIPVDKILQALGRLAAAE